LKCKIKNYLFSKFHFRLEKQIYNMSKLSAYIIHYKFIISVFVTIGNFFLSKAAVAIEKKYTFALDLNL